MGLPVRENPTKVDDLRVPRFQETSILWMEEILHQLISSLSSKKTPAVKSHVM